MGVPKIGCMEDERLMRRALELAQRGKTAPNPHVGAVVAKDGRILGEGHHARAGEAHAEVVALMAAGEEARGATLYCTLEPCNHHGRTPPCVDAILQAGVTKVVIGCLDPKRHGPVRGVDRLRESGVQVEVGVLEDEAKDLVMDFATVTLLGRSMVELKVAVTLDGRIATRSGDSRWITGEEARREVHKMRAFSDAVMVGVGTVIADNPRLDLRLLEEFPHPPPVRIVIDPNLRTPMESHIVQSAFQQATWIAHSPLVDPKKAKALTQMGVELIEVPWAEEGRLDLPWLFRELAQRDILRVLVEGGARLAGSLLDANLVDRCSIFVAPLILGDENAPGLAARRFPPERIAQALRLKRIQVKTFGEDTMIQGWLNRLDW
ncbi:MAG: bifunctional diaminohydroxyphosphoribosylaminopyrimidine deaminase/5-amino-6-(5-phosphoribosylamino)uracil reductase RibD [Sandaracinaceae bacterium]|nr:bifunctional diaminohydroxyphosphoribosylaminopyrimidine deaminase/5-amino-6-(5-phosphoribosylamino)uracil reductase RibD [Sandaracinaceae bacterium]MDW8246110.1 bifunctional diaminohydroxyphosphoribosylaminopyrimidine deaminase/5-amino-6-(5-phosphoribosylamino)uracil reductase RibD [Sandaracinaceae bacterium]